MQKSCIIPFWGFTLMQTQKLLNEFCPKWKSVPVKQYAEYLGFIVGLYAYLYAWTKPLPKFKSRVYIVRASGLGLNSSILAMSSYALSVLFHTAQLYTPTQDVVDEVERLRPKLIPATGLARSPKRNDDSRPSQLDIL